MIAARAGLAGPGGSLVRHDFEDGGRDPRIVADEAEECLAADEPVDRGSPAPRVAVEAARQQVGVGVCASVPPGHDVIDRPEQAGLLGEIQEAVAALEAVLLEDRLTLLAPNPSPP